MSAIKKVVPIVAVLSIGGFLAWKYLGGGHDPNVIRLSGNIELTEVNVAFKTPGRLVELAVDEGDSVKRDALIARLDVDEVTRALEREQAGLVASEATLTTMKTGIEYQRDALTSDINLRRAELAAAEARLKEMLAGSRPQEIEQAQSSLAEARTQYELAKADWERAERLIKNDDISAQQHDQFRTKFRASEAALRRAQETFDLVKEGPRKEQIEAQRANVERARAALKFSEAGRIDLKRREQELDARRADIARSKAQVGVIEVQKGDRTLKSPVNGVVLTKSAEAGEVLAAGAAILTLGDTEKPWVRCYIGESDLGRVKLGMPAIVKTDSYPDKTYQGRVTFISSEAEFTPKQIQTEDERVKLVYRIKIEVANPNGELKSNMPVDAEIRVQ